MRETKYVDPLFQILAADQPLDILQVERMHSTSHRIARHYANIHASSYIVKNSGGMVGTTETFTTAQIESRFITPLTFELDPGFSPGTVIRVNMAIQMRTLKVSETRLFVRIFTDPFPQWPCANSDFEAASMVVNFNTTGNDTTEWIHISREMAYQNPLTIALFAERYDETTGANSDVSYYASHVWIEGR